MDESISDIIRIKNYETKDGLGLVYALVQEVGMTRLREIMIMKNLITKGLNHIGYDEVVILKCRKELSESLHSILTRYLYKGEECI